ncbi:MAG: glycosyltransferase family 4 protein [Desulfovibrionales bacterium]|nr:glycosyltransferase family 4 protein [Desulfovibrionales bacterium]
MKILQINTEKTWRGGERQTLFTLMGLKQAGHNAELLCLRGYPMSQQAKAKSLSIHEVRNQKEAFRFLLKHGRKFDLLHAQTGKGQSLSVLTRPFHSRPVVYTRRVDFKPSGLVAKLKYHFTHQLVAISPAIKDILKDFCPQAKIPVIPSCIDTSRNVLSASEKAVQLKKKYEGFAIIASVAAMVPHKDPLTMVRAIHHLKKISSRKFIFLHFGNGELQENVSREVRRLELENDYLLMGFEKEVEGFFPIFDVFAMSSREEGLGSSVLDAFRYKVPVVSTSAGGLRDLVSGRGLVCPVEDHECLSEKINELLVQPGRYQEQTLKAHEYVLQNHSLKKMTADYIDLYRSLITGC